jgi:hypothetical protein
MLPTLLRDEIHKITESLQTEMIREKNPRLLSFKGALELGGLCTQEEFLRLRGTPAVL